MQLKYFSLLFKFKLYMNYRKMYRKNWVMINSSYLTFDVARKKHFSPFFSNNFFSRINNKWLNVTRRSSKYIFFKQKFSLHVYMSKISTGSRYYSGVGETAYCLFLLGLFVFWWFNVCYQGESIKSLFIFVIQHFLYHFPTQSARCCFFMFHHTNMYVIKTCTTVRKNGISIKWFIMLKK